MSIWTNIFGVKKASATQNKERLPSNLKWFLKSSAFSVHSVPQVLYKLPQRAKLEKFEDALLCQSPLVCKMKHLWTTYLLTLLWPGSFFFHPIYCDRGMCSPSHLIKNLAFWLWRLMAGCIDSQLKQEKCCRKFICPQMLNSGAWTSVSKMDNNR